MELDYSALDGILNYLKLEQGYRGWQSYHAYVSRQRNLLFDTINNQDSYSHMGNILLNFGLVDYKFNGNHGHTYIINYKGLDLINSGKSTRDAHEDIKRKEKLENAILRNNHISSYLGWFTLGLGLITSISVYFQYQANNLSKQNLEIAEKAYQLELKNKDVLDTTKQIITIQKEVDE